MDALEVLEERRLSTPFGEPSDPYVLGRLDGVPVAFLARHGRGHRKLPTELNYRANIYGFKLLGVEQLISVSAVGSMKKRTRRPTSWWPTSSSTAPGTASDTFFGNGLVAHVSMADPICPQLIAADGRSGPRQPAPPPTWAGPTSASKGRSSRPAPSPTLYRSWGST